ncbi:MAG: hypothetical protein QOH61_842 [Chloroflexota bacterium]|nr:hypothetical protein [Chloroflexota bacterium]
MTARRSLRLPGVVLRRARADWTVLLTAWLLLTCSTTLLTAGVLYGNTVADAGLRRSLGALPPAARSVVANGALPADRLDATDLVIGETLRDSLSSADGTVSLVITSEAYGPADAPADPAKLILLSSYADIESHATLVAGRWPEAGRAPVEATLSEAAAAAIGVATGDRLSLVSRLEASKRAEVVISGVWRAAAADAYWLGDALEREGSQAIGGFTKRGPLVLARADLLRQLAGQQLSSEWRGLPRIDRLSVDDVGALQAGLSTLGSQIRSLIPGPPNFTIATDLPNALTTAARGLLVSRSGVLLLTIEFGVLAGYAVVLVGSLIVDRRRAEAALLQTRGASRGHIAALALGEALLLAVPATLVAPLLTLGVIWLLGNVGPLAASGMLAGAEIDERAMTVAVIAGLASIGMLVLPTIVAAVTPAGARAALGRPLARTLAQRLGIDLALLVVAGIAIWQLQLYGAPLTEDVRGSLGIDPLLIAAPAIGLVAGAVAATRFLPRLAEIGERLLRGRAGLTTPLGARQLARRPLRYTRSALLLLLAAALGTFAAIYEATWTSANLNEAAYRTPTETRLVVSDYPQLASWAIGPGLRSVPGVERAVPLARLPLSAGRSLSRAEVVAFDPDALSEIATLPQELIDAGFPGLLSQLPAGRPQPAGLVLPGEPARIGITVESAMHNVTDPPSQPPVAADGSIDLSLVIENPDGIHRVKSSASAAFGASQLLEVPLATEVLGRSVSIRPPVRIVSMELTITPGARATVAGTVDVRGVSVNPSATGGDWSSVAFDPGGPAWGWTLTTSGFSESYRPPGDAPGRIVIADAVPLFGATFGGPSPQYRLRSEPELPAEVPAIVSQGFLDGTGTQVGEAVPVRARALALNLRIIGSTTIFPPLDPAVPFVIVDGLTLTESAFAQVGAVTPPREWWLQTDPGTAAGTFRDAPFSATQVTSRAELIRSLTSDPVPIGLVGALGLGAIAALAVAALGFLMSSTASAAERTGEFALLRALGLPARSVSGWLMLENVVLLGFGALLGLGLGLLLAWLVLPFVTLTQSGEAPAAATAVVVPWTALIPVVLVCVGLLIVAAAVLTRQVPAGRLTGVLRARDG